jgi:hypothetical protein
MDSLLILCGDTGLLLPGVRLFQERNLGYHVQCTGDSAEQPPRPADQLQRQPFLALLQYVCLLGGGCACQPHGDFAENTPLVAHWHL